MKKRFTEEQIIKSLCEGKRPTPAQTDRKRCLRRMSVTGSTPRHAKFLCSQLNFSKF